MIYELKNRVLILRNGSRIKLTPLEHKLLIAISDNATTFYKTILLKMYGFDDEELKRSLANVKNRIYKKTKQLKIRTIIDIGYRLETEIYFK